MSGSPRYTWQYDAQHQRIKETRVNVQGTRTTWYVHPDNAGSLAYEHEIAADGSKTNRHYLSAGGMAIGVLITNGDYTAASAVTVVKTEYWHKDRLGSLAATTDQNGVVTQRYAYDPYGKRRMSDGNYDAAGTLVYDYPNGSDRGFTGHEHLDDIGVIHMNGRIYDPNISGIAGRLTMRTGNLRVITAIAMGGTIRSMGPIRPGSISGVSYSTTRRRESFLIRQLISSTPSTTRATLGPT